MRKLAFIATVVIMGFGLTLTAAAKQSVELKNAKGESVGAAILYNGMHGVHIELNLKNLPPGEHALHIHQNAACEASPEAPQDAFKSAGPHFNPENKKHGLKNPDGPHAGDLPNFTVGPDGTAKLKLDDPRATLSGGRNGLWENGGAALVIHAKADDLVTDPAGNAGERIACGVIEKPKDYKPDSH